MRKFDITTPDSTIKEKLQHKIDFKTKPLGSLGRLEEIALQIGVVQNSLNPELKKPTMIIYAGDHGLVKEKVSPYPQEVTLQMVKNFVHGGASINVFCKQNHIDLMVVDAGVAGDLSDCGDKILHRKIATGTANMLRGSAMTADQVTKAIDAGATIVDQLSAAGVNIVGLGEMGIGNSSSAALITSYLCKVPLEATVERGAGCDDKALSHKKSILTQVRDFHGSLSDPLDVLTKVGGLELAMSVGHILRACEKRMIVLIDGYILSSAALVAAQMYPAALNYMIFCHRSASPAHSMILDHLAARPLLDLGMRLGEGSGVAVAYPLIESAVTFLNQMASFDDAGVSQSEQ